MAINVKITSNIIIETNVENEIRPLDNVEAATIIITETNVENEGSPINHVETDNDIITETNVENGTPVRHWNTLEEFIREIGDITRRGSHILRRTLSGNRQLSWLSSSETNPSNLCSKRYKTIIISIILIAVLIICCAVFFSIKNDTQNKG